MPSYDLSARQRFVADTQQIPDVFRDLAPRGAELRNRVVAALGSEKAPGILLAGMGSSHYASAMAARRLEAQGVPAIALSAEERVPECSGWPLIAVTNSGSTPELVSFIDCFRKRSEAPVIAITGGASGPIAAAADIVIDPGAGREGAFATKSFVGSLAALRIVEHALTGEPLDDLLATAAYAETLIHAEGSTTSPSDGAVTFFLGSGEYYGLAQQAALVMNEAARVPSIAIQKGEFLHGTANVMTRLPANVVLIGPSPRDSVIREFVAESPTGFISELVQDWNPEHSTLSAMAAIARLVAAQWRATAAS